MRLSRRRMLESSMLILTGAGMGLRHGIASGSSAPPQSHCAS